MRLITIFILLFIIPSALAIDYQPHDTTSIYASYTINGVLSPSDAKINIFLPDGTLDINTTMINISTGMFYYNYTWEQTGTYNVRVDFYKEGDYKGSDVQDVNIGIMDKINFGSCPTTTTGNKNMWYMFGVLLLMGMFGVATKKAGYAFIGGFGFIMFTLVTGFCGLIFGYMSIFIGLAFVLAGFELLK